MTERAYDNPVFVEDLVRNIALKLNAHPDVTWYKVEAENQESIHNHSAYASSTWSRVGDTSHVATEKSVVAGVMVQ